jgi:hypothetical protein
MLFGGTRPYPIICNYLGRKALSNYFEGSEGAAQ